MYTLSCMIGPPSGLNLRNILWHGFASSSEIPQELVILNLLCMHDTKVNILPLLLFIHTSGMPTSSLLLFQVLARHSSLLHPSSHAVADPSSPFHKKHNLPMSLLVNLPLPILYILIILNLFYIIIILLSHRTW